MTDIQQELYESEIERLRNKLTQIRDGMRTEFEYFNYDFTAPIKEYPEGLQMYSVPLPMLYRIYNLTIAK